MSGSAKRPRQVAILLFDDVEVLDFAGPFEVFSVTSERTGTARLRVFTVAETDGVVRTIGGLTILPKHSFELSPAPDILIVPGGTGSRREMDNPALVAWVKQVHRDAELVMSVCSGARILARAGLLDGIPVTTHHQVTDHLRELAPAAHVDPTRRYIDAGRIITTAGYRPASTVRCTWWCDCSATRRRAESRNTWSTTGAPIGARVRWRNRARSGWIGHERTPVEAVLDEIERMVSMDVELRNRFSQIVNDGVSRMLTIPNRSASEPRAQGKWSRKQIVGHLIDSAVNNQVRFVRAQMQEDLVFPGYDQDAWVRVQRYQDRPWPELVETWRTYNIQIAAILRAMSTAELERPRPRHNLHEIGFRELPAGTQPNLGFLVRDYVAHLEHHLSQVLA